MNPLSGSSSLVGGSSGSLSSSLLRPLSPTLAGLSALHAQSTAGLQSQSSPNAAFLAGFSSRLTSRTSAAAYQAQQQQQQQGSNSSRSGLDIFDSMSGGLSGMSQGMQGMTGMSQGMQGMSGFGGGFRSTGNFGIPVSGVGSSSSGAGGPPSTFDINEFPTLGGSSMAAGAGGSSLIGGSAPGANRPNYVGQLVKESHSTTGGSEYSKTSTAREKRRRMERER